MISGIVVPETFARSTVAREGASGTAWLSELPGIADELLERWSCVPDGQVMHGGVGIIVPVRRKAAGAAVLKISYPHPGNVHEPDAFTAWRGRGAVLLHDRDDERFGMLLERAQTSTLAAVDDDEIAAVAGCISRRLAIPAPHGLPRLSEQAGAWEEQLRKDAVELRHTMSSYVVRAATATVSELGRIQPDTLIHADLHARNILRATREPWLAVDPKGHAGDPAYDGGTFVKTFLVRLLGADDRRKALDRILDIFAEAAHLDRERIRRWAQFQVVRGAFWDRRHGFQLAPSGSRLERLTEFAEHVAELLAEPRRRHRGAAEDS